MPLLSLGFSDVVSVPTSRILGRTTAGTGSAEALTASAVRTLLNVEDGATADQSAAEILAALLTVDGAGSGLDADLLDGNSSAAFATAGHNHDATYQPLDTQLTSLAGLSYGSNAAKAIVVNGTEDGFELATVSADLSAAVILAPGADSRNVIQPTASTVKALVLKGAASQSDVLLEFQNSSGTVLGDLNADTTILRLGVGDAFKLGVGSANTIGTYTIAIGHSNNTSGAATDSALAVGKSNTVSGDFGVAIGRNCTAVGSSLAIGLTAITTGVGGVAIGFAGTGSGPSAPANTCCIGSVTNPVADVFFGKGRTVHSSATAVTINGTGGDGTNNAGASLKLAPGKSTGDATPATVILQGTAAGGSGTSAQALSDVLTITNSTTITLADAVNVVLNATTGTKIGTATGQKLGFWNATPVVQQVLATGAGATVDNVISLLQTLGLCKQS